MPAKNAARVASSFARELEHERSQRPAVAPAVRPGPRLDGGLYLIILYLNRMTKSEFAFRESAAKLFEQNRKIYFWSFTMKQILPDWHYAGVWRRFSRDLQNLYGGTLKGLRVIELHESHGIHWHALLNKRVWVVEVRRIGERYGIGWIKALRANYGSVDYLCKYLGKQAHETKFFARCCRWGTVGGFRGVRKSDVEIDSPYHRRMKICQEATGIKRFPFIFSRLVFNWHDATEEQLRAGARRFLADGHIGGVKEAWRLQSWPVGCSGQSGPEGSMCVGEERSELPGPVKSCGGHTESPTHLSKSHKSHAPSWIERSCKDD